MTLAAAATYVFADSQAALDEAVSAMRAASVVGVDTEADSRHRYPEKVCLVQLSDGERTYLVDTLADLDYDGLGRLLADPAVEKVLHGADFDIRGLDRDFRFPLAPCYDTSIAARFVGLERVGLASLLDELLGVSIPKDHRLQRADWSRRPLGAEALDYAASDVAHLGELRAALDERLRGLGRAGWVAEEFERLTEIRYVPPDPATAHLSVKGSRDLDTRALAVLKSLFDYREVEARRMNRPPGYIVPAEALVFMSANPQSELTDVPSLGPSAVRRFGQGIRKAIRAGVNAEPLQRPRSSRPPLLRATREQAARLSMLKRWRTKLGAELALDPSLLWPMRSLERLAREPGALESELESSEVRRWQRAQFEDSLRKALAGAG